jgi:hypothetical protein
MPAVQAHPESSVAGGPPHIAFGGPVVTQLVDEAEPLPDRIGKIERGDRARKICFTPDAIGGKGKNRIGQTVVLPAAGFTGIAALSRRILGIELPCHVTIDISREFSFEGRARQKNVMALLDGWRRQDRLSRNARDDNCRCGGPRARTRAHLTAANDDGQNDQEHVVGNVVDRQSDREHHKKQCKQLAPS